MAVADRGWELAAERAPRLHDAGPGRAPRPRGAGDALATTPCTFVGGDWKLGNLGRHPDGRTILVDQAYPGRPRRAGT